MSNAAQKSKKINTTKYECSLCGGRHRRTAFHALQDPTDNGPDSMCEECYTRVLALAEKHEQRKTTAPAILKTAIKHMEDRAATYDQPQGERSMGKTVTMFNLLTDRKLNDLGLAYHGVTEEEGWLFMVCLKMVRSQQGDYRADSYEDGAAYFALAGESASKERV